MNSWNKNECRPPSNAKELEIQIFYTASVICSSTSTSFLNDFSIFLSLVPHMYNNSHPSIIAKFKKCLTGFCCGTFFFVAKTFKCPKRRKGCLWFDKHNHLYQMAIFWCSITFFLSLPFWWLFLMMTLCGDESWH